MHVRFIGKPDLPVKCPLEPLVQGRKIITAQVGDTLDFKTADYLAIEKNGGKINQLIISTSSKTPSAPTTFTFVPTSHSSPRTFQIESSTLIFP